MVKHNNIIPNIHCHKKYAQSSRGPLKVRLNLNQATRKKARRLARAAKAALTAPRPMQRLRPVVHCPTQRYSSKQRLGRGFTLAELKTAGLNASYAMTVGIAVDYRRTNACEEGRCGSRRNHQSWKYPAHCQASSFRCRGTGH
jgi:large subunit ribosomal protein L13e